MYDRKQGELKSMADWARHLLLYEDGCFLKDQLFCLYVHDVIQRHDNNGKGNFFYNDKNWFGTNTPTLDDLKVQIRNGTLPLFQN